MVPRRWEVERRFGAGSSGTPRSWCTGRAAPGRRRRRAHLHLRVVGLALCEVGFNHFFRGKAPGRRRPGVHPGPRLPGVYARAFLEGRLTADQLDGFRQEHSHPGGGLPSLSARADAGFWEFPTVSMGLGPMNAIYQARFNHYLHDRGIRTPPTSTCGRSWATARWTSRKSRGLIQVAASGRWTTLTFVVNCNLQRLDGPVRATARSSRSWSPSSVARLERHQGGVGPRMGRPAARRQRTARW